MFGIKRLYTFVLKTFFPLLLATFSVCLFILLMQFLWQYVNDMVGKGVEMTVLGQLFFYAALSFVPMALPLSVLLASLMTFGNLGEHLELLAMKASGISLIRIMKPLIFVMIILMGVSFVFQNNILPSAQVKMTTILYSLRQKSPELNIPEGSFYKEIKGYNVYVRKKDKKTGMLRDMMIYDYSDGFENAMVIVADSGRLDVSEDKQSLVLTLYSGEAFENLNIQKRRSVSENVPYRRETFRLRTVLIPFEGDFNMADESLMGSRNIGKNVKGLSHFIDSVGYQVDSVTKQIRPSFINRTYANAFKQSNAGITDSRQRIDSLILDGFDSYYKAQVPSTKLELAENAKEKVRAIKNEYVYMMNNQIGLQKEIRNHQIELHKKFALAFACLCFFFIGGPLGAIIRKGGLGTPVVLSVLIFLSYYTIDTFGLKMAKQGVWEVWEGMWLSASVLIVLGVFFTYKAINDSVIMNPDSWKVYLQQFIRKIKRSKNNNR
ncbi:LptF/LptG family permease [Bacteroidales bacterium OttesenSCG-928-M11]|nr:LptF/LptG family permease [Bacteroidales bacterium OttesenSCG-928-M11]